MKKLAHYVFVLLSCILLLSAAVPAFFIWLIFRYNIIERIYWYCGDFERKHFSDL